MTALYPTVNASSAHFRGKTRLAFALLAVLLLAFAPTAQNAAHAAYPADEPTASETSGQTSDDSASADSNEKKQETQWFRLQYENTAPVELQTSIVRFAGEFTNSEGQTNPVSVDLIGAIPQDTSDENPLTVNVTFPADYADARLAGKDARFKVVIVGIVDGDAIVIDRAVQDGDTVKIRYTGYTDNYAFTGGSNMEYDEPYELEIGSNSFINGFEDALIGVIPSETSKDNLHTITVTFPADYRNTDLAGKEARFDVAIDGIFDGTYTTPELTAEFITGKLNFETEETDVVAAYRADLLNQMRENKVANLESHKLNRIVDALLDKVTFGDALPEGEAQRFEDGWIADIEYYYEYYNYMSAIYYGSAYFADLDEAGRDYTGLGPDGDWRAFLHEYAEKLVKQYLVLNMVARLSAITISEEDAKQWVRDQATDNGVDVATVLDYYSIEDIYSLIAGEKGWQILNTLVVFDYGELPIETLAAN